MIYEGAIIRRLVTPEHPGDPRLDDGNAFRTEWVLEDPQFGVQRLEGKTDRIKWTTNLELAFRYPRHLDADMRARQISPHCYARVVTAPGAESFPNLSGGNNRAVFHGDGAAPPVAVAQSFSQEQGATNLPAVDGPSAGAVKRPSKWGTPSGGGQSTSARKSRSAGETTSGNKGGRMAALRLAAERVAAREESAPGRHWWNQGQYA